MGRGPQPAQTEKPFSNMLLITKTPDPLTSLFLLYLAGAMIFALASFSLAPWVTRQAPAWVGGSQSSCQDPPRDTYIDTYGVGNGDEYCLPCGPQQPEPADVDPVCEVCLTFARVPYRFCSFCGDAPSYHHGRCCVNAPDW